MYKCSPYVFSQIQKVFLNEDKKKKKNLHLQKVTSN